MPNSLSFISKAIYTLKKLYGEPVTLVVRTGGDTNLRTGEKLVSVTEYPLMKCIRLPETYAANSELGMWFGHFKYAGEVTKGQRPFIIDSKDLPKNLVLGEHCSLRFGNQSNEYTINKVESIEDGLAYMIFCIRRE